MTPLWPDYELLDFGEGRRLERFGELVLDRPCPAADDFGKASPAAWRHVAARFRGSRAPEGKWAPLPNNWPGDLACAVPVGPGYRLGVVKRRTGQVGLFPEQFVNWRWIHDQVARHPRPLRVLNLFGYTGGSTLAAAVAGAEVTHVDASKASVQLARDNASHSGLAEAPIRWIVEDAVRYCERELKRESFYDAVILDPPSYGHGPKGEEWRLERDLPKLLGLCRDLTDLNSGKASRAFFLATCHTPGVGPAELSAYLSDAIVGHCGQPPAAGRLWLTTKDGRKLESGVYARWPK
ncbi:MAG: class I SAM-dependent methyltransferase [Planctomycetota bacterium]